MVDQRRLGSSAPPGKMAGGDRRPPGAVPAIPLDGGSPTVPPAALNEPGAAGKGRKPTPGAPEKPQVARFTAARPAAHTRCGDTPNPVEGARREALLEEIGVELRTYQNAQDAVDEAACGRLGINRSDGRALDIIDRLGQMTAGELAKESGLSTGAITTLLDRLERAGYVRRVRDHVDRRRILVELTDEARRRTSEVWGPIAQASAGGLARYSNEELLFIRDFLRSSREFLMEHLERIKTLPATPVPSVSGQPETRPGSRRAPGE